MRFLLYVLLAAVLSPASPAPASPEDRQGKNLGYYDYVQPEEYNYGIDDENDYVSMALGENDISRTLPQRKRLRPNNNYNSPIYYIRLPPQPYMFVPGLGYISQPPPSPVSQFVNLPVSFLANGKPSNIYQWGAGMESFPTEPPPKPQPPADSTIHRLPGQYNFNGKPEDIFVLRDSYNSLYGDALQNFYP